MYMFKILRLQSCPTLQENLRLEYPNHHYNTRHRDEVTTPFPRLNVSIINYKYQCSKVWNSLPVSIRNASSIGEFKSRLRNHLLSAYWCVVNYRDTWCVFDMNISICTWFIIFFALRLYSRIIGLQCLFNVWILYDVCNSCLQKLQ